MNPAISSPIGKWNLTSEDSRIEGIERNVSVFNEGSRVGKYKVAIPSEIIYFARTYWGVDSIVLEVAIKQKRANLILSTDKGPQCLFYWLKGTAPFWVSRHMARRR